MYQWTIKLFSSFAKNRIKKRQSNLTTYKPISAYSKEPINVYIVGPMGIRDVPYKGRKLLQRHRLLTFECWSFPPAKKFAWIRVFLLQVSFAEMDCEIVRVFIRMVRLQVKLHTT